jgi:hypothetical protein
MAEPKGCAITSIAQPVAYPAYPRRSGKFALDDLLPDKPPHVSQDENSGRGKESS